MGKNQKQKKARKEAGPDIKLDFGCGKSPREGFQGVDVIDFGQKHVVNLTATKKGTPDWLATLTPTVERVARLLPWPWADSSVSEAHTSHFVEHLTAVERVHFCNELYRVLKPGAKCQMITPHWCSMRAYGDMTHQWPPVSEFWFQYLNSIWRANNAPHNDFYTCDFDIVAGYSLHPDLNSRNHDYQVKALQENKEAAQDTISTLTSNKK